MFEITYEQQDGSIISEIYSGPSQNRKTDVFVYGSEDEYSNRMLVEELADDMRIKPENGFSIIDALKVIPRLRPHLRDRKIEFVIKN
jgi:hypothetical protein